MFQYRALERIDDLDGRLYVTPFGAAPSVTTIIGVTSDLSWLAEWEARVGKDEAARLTAEACAIGEKMHSDIESLMLGRIPSAPVGELQELGQQMAKTLKLILSKKVTELWGTECHLYCDDLYAGCADVACLWNGRPAILDYKSTSWARSREKTETALEQCAAYAIAHDRMFGTEVEQLVVVECNRRCDVRIHCTSGLDLASARDRWLSKLERFWS